MTTSVRLDVREGGVAVITLDGPDRLNAFCADTADRLGQAYRRCDADDAIRAVVVTGAGRAFCAGADMSADAAAFATPGSDFSASPIQPPAWRVRKLVIAAINGHAIGIGLTLALQCDLRLVAQDAKLAVPQVRRGMVGDCAVHYTLKRCAGLAVAADVLLTGRTFTGAEAAAMGLANRALPTAEVLPAALDLAREVAVYANPASVAYSKRLLWAGAGSETDADAVAAAETTVHLNLMGGPDAVEGPAAWRDNRPPVWRATASQTGDPA
ncbi:enoyl-CoA hydratase/isomerase family protein [Mycolicibacterium sp. CBM1]